MLHVYIFAIAVQTQHDQAGNITKVNPNILGTFIKTDQTFPETKY